MFVTDLLKRIAFALLYEPARWTEMQSAWVAIVLGFVLFHSFGREVWGVGLMVYGISHQIVAVLHNRNLRAGFSVFSVCLWSVFCWTFWRTPLAFVIPSICITQGLMYIHLSLVPEQNARNGRQ